MKIKTLQRRFVIVLLLACSTCALFAQTPADSIALAAAAKARKDNPNKPIEWWLKVSTYPATWYKTDEAKAMAANMLSWQDNGTGWPLMNTTREPKNADASNAGPWGEHAALIKATVNEIRFMARAYNSTKDERYKKSALGGINFIFITQYPTGGWPHSYPLRDDYTRHATYNDDMMPDVMVMLDEVVSSPEFAFVGADIRKKASASYYKGIDFVIKTQIKLNGKLTAWAQQHDEITYQPTSARKFEPAAITGGESASILFMLMKIKHPSAEVKTAIKAGVEWYHSAQINGIEVQFINGDRVVKQNPTAPPIWARYYEIPTNKPIFVGRDAIVRYSLAEIEKERRVGYAWYNNSGTAVFNEYNKWLAANPG